ncbi:hypothetical protein BKA61DRAFT_105756 [Leptodontidium sp. MPI-SDFR-AT-0119]|nr:hypothetical protein BKA61DRAFT_105756 [Leptodontidium sp. MPI-SDFR-AT-0119]
MLRVFFIWLLLVDISIAASQTCIWKDGSTAENFVPCANSTQTSGNCCLNGEACLDTGLCYGALGLIYRGACINEWGGGDCPTYCDAVTDKWANLYPCAFGGSGSTFGPESFWCGADGTDMCTATNESFILKIAAPGNVKKVETTSSASTSSTGSSTLTGSATSSPVTSTSTSPGAAQETGQDKESGDSNNGVAIGLGVALGVVVLLWAASAFFLFRKNRQQKAMIAMLSGATSVEPKDEPDGRGLYRQPNEHTEMEGHIVGSELDNSPRKPMPVELGN